MAKESKQKWPKVFHSPDFWGVEHPVKTLPSFEPGQKNGHVLLTAKWVSDTQNFFARCTGRPNPHEWNPTRPRQKFCSREIPPVTRKNAFFCKDVYLIHFSRRSTPWCLGRANSHESKLVLNAVRNGTIFGSPIFRRPKHFVQSFELSSIRGV